MPAPDTYQEFLASKGTRPQYTGREVTDADIHPLLFPFQRDLVRWSVRKGRAALFADTGLGKTFMQLEWARLTGQRAIIAAPLAVARQTAREAARLGIELTYARKQADASRLTITNYEMLEAFDPAAFGAVVLDESSILKSFDGKTRTRLIEMFADTPYRLCCTATPAPNDIAELANHAEFLGVCSRVEMLSTYFVHDDQGWRLKGHATDAFYKWLASWGMSIRRPSDLGYADDGYDLPGLSIESHIIPTDYAPEGQLFGTTLRGITDRAAVRRSTVNDRVRFATDLVWRSWGCERQKRTDNTCGTTTRITKKDGTDAPQSSGPLTTPPEKNDTATTQTSESNARNRRATATNDRNGTDDSLASSGLPQMNTIYCSSNKAVSAPSAVNVREIVGTADFTSTIATSPAQSEACCVPNAISPLESSETIPTFSDEPWIIWCGLNEEQDAIAALLGDRCVSVYGSLSPEEKVLLTEQWVAGEVPVIVTKPTVLGYGMNFQHCADMVFVGLSDSYEQYYQCIRRCFRFGQTRPVAAHIVLTDLEETIYANVLRKEAEADRTARELVKHVAEFEKAELDSGNAGRAEYRTHESEGEGWRLLLGDSAERLRELETDSVDLAVFSPPFQTLYVYSPTERDLGNSQSPDEFWTHFGYIIDELLRVMKPGRNVAVHVAQLATTLTTHGVIGLSDFRGETIRRFQERGFVYHGEVCIDKDPQAQAIRTHSKGLLFVQLRKDASWLRPGLADYVLAFRKPGENAEPIHPDLTNDEWIEYARPIWYGIRETDTLNVAEARSEKDERHICPLQLGTIERVVRLWSNPGETVLSPFAGIGSEGYESILLKRRFVGIELKPEYYETACRNLQRAEDKLNEGTLFSELEAAAV